MERPAASASRADWDEYAQSLDIDPEEYSNKDDLIAAVDAEEALTGVSNDDDDAEAKSERSPAWRKAYEHALSIEGNTEKTAAIFADQNFQTEEFGG